MLIYLRWQKDRLFFFCEKVFLVFFFFIRSIFLLFKLISEHILFVMLSSSDAYLMMIERIVSAYNAQCAIRLFLLYVKILLFFFFNDFSDENKILSRFTLNHCITNALCVKSIFHFSIQLAAVEWHL